MTELHVGFTGTRNRNLITAPQLNGLTTIFNSLDKLTNTTVFCHHGDCIGGDLLFYSLARKRTYNLDGSGSMYTVCHPPTSSKYRAFTDNDITKEPKNFLDRNIDIVEDSDIMIGLPGTQNEVIRSGTWTTIRYSKACNKPLLIMYPDGSTNNENFRPYEYLLEK